MASSKPSKDSLASSQFKKLFYEYLFVTNRRYGQRILPQVTETKASA
ncbi:hypothetical protein [Spirosoma flavum]|uniref:Uncharacterized protein n=1 Tax=Spirosoma flavum TaxID=2048557 RepID=A0ABW6AM12_9BACT